MFWLSMASWIWLLRRRKTASLAELMVTGWLNLSFQTRFQIKRILLVCLARHSKHRRGSRSWFTKGTGLNAAFLFGGEGCQLEGGMYLPAPYCRQ
jgi:hypothetical protein